MPVLRHSLSILAAALVLAALPSLPAQTVTTSSFPAVAAAIQASDGNYWVLDGQLLQTVYPDGAVTTAYNFSSLTDYYPQYFLEGQDGYFYGIYPLGVNATGLFRLSATGAITTVDIANYSYTGMFQGSNGNLYLSYSSGIIEYTTSGVFVANISLTQPQGGFASSSYPDILASDGNIYVEVMSQDENDDFDEASLYQAPQSLAELNYYTALSAASNISSGGYSNAPTEAANGNLYLPTAYYSADEVTLGSTPTDTAITLGFAAEGKLFAASDGQLYGISYVSGSTGGAYYFNSLNPSSNTSVQLGSAADSASSVFTQGSDGAFYADGVRLAVSPGLLAPVQLTPSATTVPQGTPFTLNWQVLNATSLQMQLCSAFLGNFTTVPGWSGLQTGTVTNGVMSGSATITLTTPGTYSFALTCGGIESGNATVTISGTSATTTALQTSTPTVVAPGQASLTATVATTGGSPVSTGTVQFKVGSTVIGKVTLNSNGIAMLTAPTTGIPGGTYSIVANYLGDTNDFTSTSSPVVITVQATDSVALTASATNVPQGTPITLTATLHATAGTPAATGTIKFTYEGDGTSGTLGSVTLNAHGQASITIPATASKGEYAVTATYTGDTYNQPAASSTLAVYVTAATTTTLRVSETQIHPGDSVVLTANVASGPTPVSGGQVNFTVAGNVVATAQVNTQGVAATTVVAPSVPPGTYPLAAQYDGTTLDAPSTSSPVNVTVLK